LAAHKKRGRLNVVVQRVAFRFADCYAVLSVADCKVFAYAAGA
jgi:hypothetical protein